MRLPYSDIPAFRRDPLALLESRAFQAERGFVDLYLGRKPIVMITEPEMARKVMKWDTDEVDKGSLVQKIRPLIGDSLLVNIGDAHRRSKSAIHRHVQRNAIADYLAPMMAIVTGFAARLARDPEFTTTQETPLLSLRLACAAFFGENVLTDADQLALVSAVQGVESEIAAEMFSPLAGAPWRTGPRMKRIEQARKIVHFVLNEVRRRGEVSPLLQSMEEGGLSEDEIVAEFLGLFIAGHHSTGATIGWMLYHLAKDPSIGELIALEADATLPALEGGDIGALKSAPLSAAFSNEIMRLYPGGWWTSREVLKPIELTGRRFDPGRIFMISPWILHRDESYWDEPEELKLDRTYARPGYMPFGTGPRACIGMTIAAVELQLVALQIASAFDFDFLGAPEGVDPVPSVALLAPPFRLRAKPKTDEAFRKQVA